VGSGTVEESGCLRDGIQPLAMVVPIGGMQAPCSNGSQWRFVEEVQVQVQPQQGCEPVATSSWAAASSWVARQQALGWCGSDWTTEQHTGGNLLLLGYSG